MPQGNEEPAEAGPAAMPEALPPAAGTQHTQPPAKQPLPPEMPRTGQPLPPEAPPMPSEPPPVKQPLPPALPPEAPSTEPEGDGGPGREWWRPADVRDEWQDAWDTHGQDAVQAAYEIGAQIGAAVTAHLPDPYAAAQQRGLDLRWLRLGVTVPALALALLVTWGGRSPENRMAHYVAREGVFAPLGWVLLPVLVLAVLMALPFGGVLGAVIGGLARGLVALLRRAWAAPYAGYVLRLAVAVAAWSFVIAAAHLAGRVVIHWLTGV